jgi:cell division protein FtsI/penicillin-binding protein 2
MKEQKIKIFIFFILISLSFLGLIFRLAHLQLLQNRKMSRLALSNYLKKEIISVERGIIYDRNMKELAVSIETKSLYAHPKKVKNKEEVSKILSNLINVPVEKIIKKLNKESNFVWIKRKLPLQIAEKIKSLDIEGLGFIKEYKRFYPKKELASHIIGFVGIDNRGLEGIELYYDHQLRGSHQEIEVTKDAIGRTISLGRESSPKIFDGFNIVLTIDEVIQHICEVELQKVCEKYKAISGTIIVMNPKNGEILALSNYPTFNPNHISYYPPYKWRNRAITDVFEPGSTFKIFTTAAILINRVVTSSDYFECQGSIEIAGYKMRCYDKHGRLSFEDVIAKSCNVGTIKAALRLNKFDFHRCLKRFGFGSFTGINLPGERNGTLRIPRYWYKLTLPNFAIGQGISTTTLQLTNAACSIANGGFLMKPLIVKKITNSKNEIIKEYQPTCIRRVIHPNVARYITYILQKVISKGTGKKASLSNCVVAGKTGTAQKADVVKGGYAKDKFFSSFIGYIPAHNPKLVISVFVNEPKKIYYGGEVAAPVFRRIVKKILAYKKSYFISEPQRIEYIDITSCDILHLNKKKKILFVKDHSKGFIMPNIYGKTMRCIWEILSPYKVRIKFYGSGLAIKSSPKPGKRINPGEEIKIWFSSKT